MTVKQKAILLGYGILFALVIWAVMIVIAVVG